MLLTSWVEHNKKHSEKFRKWAQQAKNIEGDAVYSSALQAAEEVEKASEQLSRVLIKLEENS